MLRELIQLWAGGPAITLGSYFVAFKYVFSALFLLWAVSLLRWPQKVWFVTGALVLAGSSLLVFQKPLNRPYGVVADGQGLEELGEVMVVAARKSASDGPMVGAAHSRPGWGLTMAALSGFRPARLLRLYPWLPLMSLLGLGLAVSWSVGSLSESDELPGGALSGLATFVTLFLSSHRLSFLRPEGAFWVEFFWLTPAVGFAFAGIFVGWRLLGASSRLSALWASLVLGFVGSVEPRVVVCFALGVLVWMLATRARVGREGVVVAISTVAAIGFGNWSRPVSLPADIGSWHDSINRIFAVTLDLGLVFLLAAYGVWQLRESGKKPERLLACCAGAALLIWVLVSFSTRLAELLDPRLVNGYVRLLVALCASYGVYRLLAVWVRAFPEIPKEWRFVHRFPSARFAMTSVVVLSLPWCFPYWWEPVRMDPVYVESVPAISRRYLAMGEALRSTVDADAVFAAGPSYAPWIPALSGRRVLLTGASVADGAARDLAQEFFIRSQDPARIESVASVWGLTHVAWGRLDQPTSEDELSPVELDFFVDSPLFEERYRDQRWLRVFEYDP